VDWTLVLQSPGARRWWRQTLLLQNNMYDVHLWPHVAISLSCVVSDYKSLKVGDLEPYFCSRCFVLLLKRVLQYYWNTYQSPLQQEFWVPVYTMTRCSILLLKCVLQYYWNTYQSPLQQEFWVPVYTMTRCSVLLLKRVLQYYWNTYQSPLQQEFWVLVYTMTRCYITPETLNDWTATKNSGCQCVLWYPYFVVSDNVYHICNKMWTKPNLRHSKTCRTAWLMGEIPSLDIR
jgi:hypothetical protein